MKIMAILLLLATSGFLFPTQVIADNESSEAITADVPIDPNCMASPDVCRAQAIKQQERIKQCEKDPEWCKRYKDELKKKRETNQSLCKENPKFCEAKRELAQKCKQQPNQCQEFRQAFKNQQQEAQQQWCTNNPERCTAWQAEQEEIQKKCQEMRQQLLEKYSDRP